MKKLYAYLLYALLGVEVLFFTGFYIQGPQGMRTLNQMYAEQTSLKEGLTHLTQEVAPLKHDIDDWNNHPFHKQKEARENLQMAFPDDEIFYLT